MNEQELTKKLTAPFEAKDVEWRIQQTTQDKSRGLAVAFITSRAIQKRLDETVGPFHWKTEFSPWHQIVNKGSQLCALSIYDEERKEWVTKTDGAENSDIEPVKGGLSDSSSEPPSSGASAGCCITWMWSLWTWKSGARPGT